ncbi:recombinase family protein [Undibacterium sp. Di27W]|uniref:recombinase family protein n=1 Tax=Undibacterium sp. Di27W TaxID=3413036 RepID=UPI003BF095B2
MQNIRVYSYLRFSDPRQSTGSSIERQLAYTQKWAEERGLQLDETLSMRDEGLSAYHQRHVTQGALGAFLLAISEGRITPGSVLIVEGLDRLSRAEPIQAQAQLAQIINAGITVVTASDGREYNRASLKAQPMDLVYSLLVMIRAHEESDTKSKRVKASIRRLCEQWQAGTYRGIIRNGHDPSWVKWNGSSFDLVEKQAQAVKLSIEMYIRGYGGVKITQEVHNQKLRIFENKSSVTSFYKMLKRKTLLGIKTLEIDGEEYNLHNYYPPLLTEQEFAELTAMNNKRVKNKGKGEIPGIITGLGISYCGYCGSAVVGQNIMTRAKKPDGTLNDGHRRLYCCGTNNTSDCLVAGSCSVVPVEKAIFAYCSDQLNLTSLMQNDSYLTGIRAELIEVTNDITEQERQLERVTDALLAAENGATPLVFVRKARELETSIVKAKAEQSRLEVELRKTNNKKIPELAEAWGSLIEKCLAQNYDARMQARKLVQDTFERIVVYHRSVSPVGDNAGKNNIDLLLLAKGGRPRLLSINRRTGAFTAGEEGGLVTAQSI